MASIVLDADSTTLVLNGTAITDLIDGDILELTPVNPLTSHVNSSNGGVNINKRSDGGVHDLTVRVQRYSASDVFLNNASNQASPVVFNGSLKEDYTRDGTAGAESWILENGSITTRPTSTKNNTDGNSLQEYTIRFRNCSRNI